MAANGPYAGSQRDHGYNPARYSMSTPSVEDLRLKAASEVRLTKDSSLDSLLSEAGTANRLVTSHQEFGRPDRAYIEWLKAEQYINLVVQNPDGPFMSDTRKGAFTQIQTVHANQRFGVTAIQNKFHENHARTANGVGSVTSAQAGSRQAIYSHTQSASNGASQINRHTFYDVAGSGGLPNGTSSSSQYGAPRPMSSPQDDPLMARFQRMKINNGSKESASSGIPESLRPARPSASNGADNSTKPAGPRPMPVDKELPATPPRLSTVALLESLPRAPSPIYTPIRGTQHPNATPPRASIMAQADSQVNRVRERRPFPELQTQGYIEAEELFSRLREFKILLIDLRDRDRYNAGHIHGKSIICVEPFSLKAGMSLEQLKEDAMLYAPEEETAQVDKIRDFDLVVYYDDDTSDPRFLRAPSQTGPSVPMRYLYETLVDYNEDAPLVRRPVFLRGGLSAWVDLVSENALQVTKTGSRPGPRPQQLRAPLRRSVVGTRSVKDSFTARQPYIQPLSPEDARKWKEKAEREETAAPNLADYQTRDGETSVAAQANKEFFFHENVSDYLTRPRGPTEKGESMTSPVSVNSNYNPRPTRQPPPPPGYGQRGPEPTIPTRPAPTASRPSYSGVSDQRNGAPVPQYNNAINPPARYQHAYRDMPLHRTGLANFGNTCYMNSVIQCLSATIPLTMMFSTNNWQRMVVENRNGSNGLMPKIYANLIREMWADNRNDTRPPRAIRPASLRTFCARLDSRWDSDRQQDAHEFLSAVIDTLHEDFNQQWQRQPLKELTLDEERYRESQAKYLVSKKEWQRTRHMRISVIDDLFAGQYASTITCTRCRNTSTVHQVWPSLMLPIPRRSHATSLQDCIKDFCAEKKIDEYRCTRCGKDTKSVQKITLTRLPTILVLTFLRYGDSGSQKVETPIDFPLNRLDMLPYMADTMPRPGDEPDPAITPPFNYDCYAVIRHLGKSKDSGHYIAACKDPGRRCWREFNDERTTDFDPLKSPKLLDPKQAYIVFYQRSVPR